MIKKTILIAENEMIISLDIKSILDRHNINTEIVGRSGSLLEKTLLLKPDLIIADYNLKNEDQVKGVLSDITKDFHIPIILITTYNNSYLEESLGSLIYSGFLSIPFDCEELLQLIRKHIN